MEERDRSRDRERVCVHVCVCVCRQRHCQGELSWGTSTHAATQMCCCFSLLLFFKGFTGTWVWRRVAELCRLCTHVVPGSGQPPLTGMESKSGRERLRERHRDTPHAHTLTPTPLHPFHLRVLEELHSWQATAASITIDSNSTPITSPHIRLQPRAPPHHHHHHHQHQHHQQHLQPWHLIRNHRRL